MRHAYFILLNLSFDATNHVPIVVILTLVHVHVNIFFIRRGAMEKEDKKKNKRKLYLVVSNEFYEWFKEEAEKRGLRDRMGRFLEMFAKECREKEER